MSNSLEGVTGNCVTILYSQNIKLFKQKELKNTWASFPPKGKI